MVNNSYVYYHYTADEHRLFYIGKGKDNRLNSRYKRNQYWKRVVDKHGFYADVIVANLTEQQAFECEKVFIQAARRDGYELCNLIALKRQWATGRRTDQKSHTQPHTAEARAKMSIARKKWWAAQKDSEN